MPGVKPTNDQLRERIEFTTECLAQMLHMSQIKAAVRGKFGAELSARTIDRYVALAREEINRAAACPRDDFIAQITATYSAIIRNQKIAPQAKCRALEGIRAMFGLDAPKRQEITGADGQPLMPAGAEEALRVVYGERALAPVAPAENGNGEHRNGG
jgi:hypothetical protein